MIAGVENLTVDEQRVAVVAEALSWVRTPYHHGARVKGAGVDCGQLLIAVYEAMGVVPSVACAEYPPDWHLHRDDERYLALVRSYSRPIPFGPPGLGDIVLYRFGRCISHGAIVVEWPLIVHADAKVGAVVVDDAIANQRYAPREAGYWSPWLTA